MRAGFSQIGVWIALGVVALTVVLAFLSRHEGRRSVISTLLGGLGVGLVALTIGGFGFGVMDLFLAGLLLVIFVCGAVWGVLVLLYLAYRNREAVLVSAGERSLITLGLVFGFGVIIAVPLLGVPLPGLLIVLGVLVGVSPLVLTISRRLEGVLFRRSVDPSGLVLGDWLAEDVVVDGVVVISTSNPGLSERQIGELRDLWDRKVISRIVIKDGIAFVPAFLFALCIMFVF